MSRKTLLIISWLVFALVVGCADNTTAAYELEIDLTDGTLYDTPFMYQHSYWDMESTTGWGAANDAQNLETSTTKQEGTYSLEWDKSAGTNTYSQIETGMFGSVDVSGLSAGHMTYWLYLSDITDVAQLQFQIGSDAWTSYSRYVYDDAHLKNGWNFIVIDLINADYEWNGGVDWADVDDGSIRVIFDANGDLLNDIRVDDLKMYANDQHFIYLHCQFQAETIAEWASGNDVQNLETTTTSKKGQNALQWDKSAGTSDRSDVKLVGKIGGANLTDFQDDKAMFWFYTDNSTYIEKIQFTMGSNGFAKYSIFENSSAITTGWNHVSIINFASPVATGGGGVDWADVDDLQIRIDTHVATDSYDDFKLDDIIFISNNNVTKLDLSAYSAYLAADFKNVRIEPTLTTYYSGTALYVVNDATKTINVSIGGENNFDETHTAGDPGENGTVTPTLTATGSTIYTVSFYDEADGALWSPWSDSPDEFFISGECDTAGSFSTNMTGDTSTEFVVVTDDTPRRIVGTVTYSDGSEYYRQQYGSTGTAIDLYFLEISTFPASELVTTIQDLTGGEFTPISGSDIVVTFKTYSGGTLKEVASDYLGGDRKIRTYLANSRSYSIEIDNGVEVRDLGWLNDPTVGTQTIWITNLEYSSYDVYPFKDFMYSIDYNSTYPSVSCTWATSGGTMDNVYFYVYNVTGTNNTKVYETSSTANSGAIVYNVTWEGINNTWKVQCYLKHADLTNNVTISRRIQMRSTTKLIDFGWDDDTYNDVSTMLVIGTLMTFSAGFGAEGCFAAAIMAAGLKQFGWFDGLNTLGLWMIIFMSGAAMMKRRRS